MFGELFVDELGSRDGTTYFPGSRSKERASFAIVLAALYLSVVGMPPSLFLPPFFSVSVFLSHSLCLSRCLPLSLYLYLSLCLSLSVYLYLSVCLSGCLSVSLTHYTIYLPVSLCLFSLYHCLCLCTLACFALLPAFVSPHIVTTTQSQF